MVVTLQVKRAPEDLQKLVSPLLAQRLQSWRKDVRLSDEKRDEFFDALQAVLVRNPAVSVELDRKLGGA